MLVLVLVLLLASTVVVAAAAKEEEEEVSSLFLGARGVETMASPSITASSSQFSGAMSLSGSTTCPRNSSVMKGSRFQTSMRRDDRPHCDMFTGST